MRRPQFNISALSALKTAARPSAQVVGPCQLTVAPRHPRGTHQPDACLNTKDRWVALGSFHATAMQPTTEDGADWMRRRPTTEEPRVDTFIWTSRTQRPSQTRTWHVGLVPTGTLLGNRTSQTLSSTDAAEFVHADMLKCWQCICDHIEAPYAGYVHSTARGDGFAVQLVYAGACRPPGSGRAVCLQLIDLFSKSLHSNYSHEGR